MVPILVWIFVPQVLLPLCLLYVKVVSLLSLLLQGRLLESSHFSQQNLLSKSVSPRAKRLPLEEASYFIVLVSITTRRSHKITTRTFIVNDSFDSKKGLLNRYVNMQ